MNRPMTDQELQEWLTDIDCGCQPTGEAFRRLARRCVEAEQERDLRRLESLIREYGSTAVREALAR